MTREMVGDVCRYCPSRNKGVEEPFCEASDEECRTMTAMMDMAQVISNNVLAREKMTLYIADLEKAAWRVITTHEAEPYMFDAEIEELKKILENKLTQDAEDFEIGAEAAAQAREDERYENTCDALEAAHARSENAAAERWRSSPYYYANLPKYKGKKVRYHDSGDTPQGGAEDAGV